ncbi:MAG TPA: PEGA domain-containing protein [Kofleriaceae bacterium]|nr:PEGA domain-containing protein [Kofleriaceae bacterium]
MITEPPGARAIVAGQTLTTPATFVGLTPGTIAIAVDQPGYLSIARSLTLAPGEHKIFQLALVRKPDTHEQPAAKVGLLNARTTPYSEVYEGGHHLGQTPFADVRLPAGAHTLTFKNPSHKPVTKRVVIRAGQTTKLSFALP